MGNRLKSMLDDQNNGFAMTLTFKSKDERENFIEAINRANATGKPQVVPIPQEMETKKTNGDYQYPYELNKNIVNMMVFPVQDIFEIPIMVDGAKSDYVFLRNRTEDEVHITSKNPKIVNVELVLNVKENKLKFTYTSQPEMAETIDELINEYTRFLALLEELFDEKKMPERLKDIKGYFRQRVRTYKRAKEISETLSIKVTPQKIIDQNNSDGLIEKLFILLINKGIVRQEDQLDYVEMANVEKLEVGQELVATYLETECIEIFGEQREIYKASCFFGAEIQKIEPKENGNNIVYFKDSEKRQRYRAYSAFLSEEDAEKELNEIMKKREQYEYATSWLDQVHEMSQE